jgi:hypothetical protein
MWHARTAKDWHHLSLRMQSVIELPRMDVLQGRFGPQRRIKDRALALVLGVTKQPYRLSHAHMRASTESLIERNFIAWLTHRKRRHPRCDARTDRNLSVRPRSRKAHHVPREMFPNITCHLENLALLCSASRENEWSTSVRPEAELHAPYRNPGEDLQHVEINFDRL